MYASRGCKTLMKDDRKISEEHDKVFQTGCREIDASGPRANAAFVVLARNKELDGVIQSVKSIERHFNRWYNYPYVFLNDENFNSTFKETIQNYTSGKVEFGTIDPAHWGFPDWIDPKVAKEGIAKKEMQQLCTVVWKVTMQCADFTQGTTCSSGTTKLLLIESRFFYKHELLAKYEWYWRLEPEIKYFCDIT